MSRTQTLSHHTYYTRLTYRYTAYFHASLVIALVCFSYTGVAIVLAWFS